jgi:hypothetical protein
MTLQLRKFVKNIAKVVIITTIMVTGISSKATTEPLGKYEQLIAALIKVESNGNDRAIGDRHMKERAFGPLQIRQPCVDDVNQVLGTHHKAEDLLGNRSLSVLVCRTYLDRYAAKKALGREPSLEDMARIWNGGPSGWKKQSTIQYWTKVKAALATAQAPRGMNPKAMPGLTKKTKQKTSR